MKADNKQKALIHICKSQLIGEGIIDESGYRGLLRQWFDVESSRDLDYEQATVFINEFVKMGAVIKRKRASKKKLPPEITQLPSPQILMKIENLRSDIRWLVHDGYFRLIRKRFRIERPRTMREAQMIVEMLKSILARQQKASEPKGVHLHRDGGAMHGGRWRW